MTVYQKKLAQVCQLLSLARSTTFEKERESAQKMAQRIMSKYGISGPEVVAFRASLEPKPRPRPAPAVRRAVFVPAGSNVTFSFNTTGTNNIQWTRFVEALW